ncbi:MAG: glycosyltransferase [Gemmatimonadota bacterium]|nr:glycosyltransferase [Gemmatimonadota bacterium]
MRGRPAVSVIIPTFHRPELVLRAVNSVLQQALSDLEVIVVVDGRDAATSAALGTLDDARLSIHVPDRHLGNADARNAGVALARAPWVAFLDDDDAWLPAKLERQLAVAQRARCARPIVSCRVLVHGAFGDMIWPRRMPTPGEDWSEYFFCRRTPFTGEGMITMTSILTSRALVLEAPFASGLARHVDPDWVLRASRVPGVCVEFVADPDPLVVWYMDYDRPRITTLPDWRASFAWCRANRRLFSDRGYAAFVLHVVGSNAAAEHTWHAFPLLLREAVREGRPALVDVASHVANFCLPAVVQRQVAAWYARWAAPAAPV